MGATFTVEVTDEQEEFLLTLQDRFRCSRREAVRRVLETARTDAMLARALGGEPVIERDPDEGLTDKERAIRAVRRHFNLEPAAEEMRIPVRELRAWCQQDPEFAAAVQDAQDGYLAAVEADLVAIGRNLMKGSVTALKDFLEAHHPRRGRFRREDFMACLNPMLDTIATEYRKEFEEYPERLEAVATRVESYILKRLTAFS